MKKNEMIFEQYKLYVNTAERVSDRRQSANNFFLTINSILLSFSGYLSATKIRDWYFLIAITGIVISFFWLKIINSYKQLNSGKFKMIHKIEEELPIKLFKDEWEYLGRGKTKEYVKLTVVERGVPITFMLMYLVIIILMV